jgi:hypothetical protein
MVVQIAEESRRYCGGILSGTLPAAAALPFFQYRSALALGGAGRYMSAATANPGIKGLS